MAKQLFFGFILVIISLSSCKTDLDPVLNISQKKYVDSLTRIEKVQIDSTFQLICEQRQDSMIKYYYDSIYQVRIRALQKLEK